MYLRTIGGKRHRYVIARPDRFGVDPVAVDGIGGRLRRHSRGERERGEKKSPSISKHHITRFSLGEWRMSGLTRHGIAESVSRDEILRRERVQGGKYSFSLFS